MSYSVLRRVRRRSYVQAKNAPSRLVRSAYLCHENSLRSDTHGILRSADLLALSALRSYARTEHRLRTLRKSAHGVISLLQNTME